MKESMVQAKSIELLPVQHGEGEAPTLLPARMQTVQGAQICFELPHEVALDLLKQLCARLGEVASKAPKPEPEETNRESLSHVAENLPGGS